MIQKDKFIKILTLERTRFKTATKANFKGYESQKGIKKMTIEKLTKKLKNDGNILHAFINDKLNNKSIFNRDERYDFIYGILWALSSFNYISNEERNELSDELIKRIFKSEEYTKNNKISEIED